MNKLKSDALLDPGFASRYLPDMGYGSLWPNLKFSDKAYSRLMYTVGFFRGLVDSHDLAGESERKWKLKELTATDGVRTRVVAGPRWITPGLPGRKLNKRVLAAKQRLLDLQQELVWLSAYGAHFKYVADSVDGQSQTKDLFRVPSYKVLLNDDGCWGSFSLRWYQAIQPAAYTIWFEKAVEEFSAAKARKILKLERQADRLDPTLSFEDRRAKLHEISAEQTRVENGGMNMDEFHAKYQIDRSLSVWCPDLASYVHYRFAFNGGLIYHFERDNLLQGSWSVHT